MNENNLNKEDCKKIKIDPTLGQKFVAPKNPEVREFDLKNHFKEVSFDSSKKFNVLKKDIKKEKAKSYKNVFCFDNSIHTEVKRFFASEIDSCLKRLNYKKAILVCEEMFEFASSITSSEINNYIKIIKTHNKLNPKKTIVPKNYEVYISKEYYKSAFGKFKINRIIDIPRGFNANKYDGYSIIDLYDKTNRICPNILFDFCKDELVLRPSRDIKTIDIDLYNIVKDPYSNLFIVRGRNNNVVLLNNELLEFCSYNASNIFKSNRYWFNSIGISKSADTILLTGNEEVYLFDLSFREKSIWVLPGNITEGKVKEGSVFLDPEIQSHLNTLGIEGIPEKEQVNTAYKTLAKIYHPDKNPDNLIESGEKMKKINAAKDYLEEINFDNYKNNYSPLFGQLIALITKNGVYSAYEPNEVCASFIDKHNLIYLACKSGNVYKLTTDGNLICTIDFAINNKYFHAFDSIAIVNDTLVVCEGLYIHLFKNNEHVKTIFRNVFSTFTHSKVKFMDNFILLITDQSLTFYDTNGDIVDILIFNRKIRNVFSNENNVIIEIPGNILEFSV